MALLLIGSHGYVGAAILDVISELGIEVLTSDRLWFDHAAVRPLAPSKPDFDDFRQITDADLAGVDAVIHLAAYSNDPTGALRPGETLALNTRQTLAFARRARRAGVGTFVFSSSCSVYGNSHDAIVTEDSPTAPLTHYARSKLLTEQGLLHLQTPEFRVAALRGATAFGASAVPRCDLLLNEFCAEAACGRLLRLNSRGNSWRPFMPVREFARALVHAALNKPRALGHPPVWNVAPPDMQMTVMDAVLRAGSVAGLTLGLPRGGEIVDHRSYRVSGARFLEAFPRFAYRASFEEEIAATIAAFRAIATLEQDLKSERFIRLAALREAEKVAG